jgi:hypothetical protein
VIATTACGYSPDLEDCSVRCGGPDECPADFSCEMGVCRAPGASGACGAPGSTTLRQTADDKVDRNLVFGCTNADGTTADGSWYRIFSLDEEGISGEFDITHVNLGICFAIGMPDVTLKVGTYGGGIDDATLDLARATVLTTVPVPVPPTQITELIPISAPTKIPAGSIIFVEIAVPNMMGTGEQANIGLTLGAETHPAYVRSPKCGPAAATSTTTAGPSNGAFVISVTGNR